MLKEKTAPQIVVHSLYWGEIGSEENPASIQEVSNFWNLPENTEIPFWKSYLLRTLGNEVYEVYNRADKKQQAFSEEEIDTFIDLICVNEQEKIWVITNGEIGIRITKLNLDEKWEKEFFEFRSLKNGLTFAFRKPFKVSG